MITRGAQHGRPERWRSDRGALSLEMVVLLPLALSLLFLAVQGAVYYQGRTVALASAQEGARGAAGYEQTDEHGRSAALDFAARAGGDGLLESPDVEVTRDRGNGTVTVRVTGTTMSIIPGWDPQVSQSSTRAIEEFTRVEDFEGSGIDRTERPSW
ncbi:pilus assembly protein [Janibacter indicus]|uniref:Pilus assembly protein n=1 Tax=Janibacter indicus TaxID=857417 RepID=A0A7L9J0P9_9MICO|nr:TadE/TadG family type IV pilus assembly protein [Janibacter indicus]QOK22613.1 pilus assembly protein [Janibacter indicus]